MSDTEKRLVQRLMSEVWGRGDLSQLEELVDPSVVVHLGTQHDPVVGIDACRELIATYQVLFGDVDFSIEDQLQDGDKVVTRWHARRAGDTGEAPTMGISIHRFSSGRIVEAWDTWDMMRALGGEADSSLLDRLGLTL